VIQDVLYFLVVFSTMWCVVQRAVVLVLLDLLLLGLYGPVVLGEVLAVLLVGRLGEARLLPQVGGQVLVGLGDGGVGRLGWKDKSWT
jgi:hypothetical protein